MFAALWEILVATAGDPSPGMGVFTEQLHELVQEAENTKPTDPAQSTHAVSRVTLRRLLLADLEEGDLSAANDGGVSPSFVAEVRLKKWSFCRRRQLSPRRCQSVCSKLR
jgi:hypothetical protein